MYVFMQSSERVKESESKGMQERCMRVYNEINKMRFTPYTQEIVAQLHLALYRTHSISANTHTRIRVGVAA
jgi:hypothetical protein